MSPQRWAQHSCSWTRQGSTHLFVLRVVDWSCGMKNCLLCVVKYLTDILQRSSRALEKEKKDTSQFSELTIYFLKRIVLILCPFSTGHFYSLVFCKLFKSFLPLNFLFFLLKFIRVFSSDQQRVPHSAKTLPLMFHPISFQPDNHVVLWWLLECTYMKICTF